MYVIIHFRLNFTPDLTERQQGTWLHRGFHTYSVVTYKYLTIYQI